MTAVLAGDIGGTNARLALYDADGLRQLASDSYSSGRYESLVDIVRSFLDRQETAGASACFGVAGPVIDGRARITNLPWVVEADELRDAFGFAQAAVINDLEALAHGIQELEPADLVALNAGSPDAAGNAAIIAAGTGLGEAGLYWDGRDYHPFACEGGHSDFAPANELQIELLEFLSRRFAGHVSWERVLSGPGLVNLHDFLRQFRGADAVSSSLQIGNEEDPAEITESALAGRCPLCIEALDLFVSLFGAEAGNLGLKVMASGGVYLGGGIAPRIVEKLQSPLFIEAFVAKGRMRPVLQRFPVHIVMNDQTGLLGAARYAARLLQE